MLEGLSNPRHTLRRWRRRFKAGDNGKRASLCRWQHAAFPTRNYCQPKWQLSQGVEATPASIEQTTTDKYETAAPTSSAEYVVGEIKRHKLGLGIVLVILFVVAVFAYFVYLGRGGKEAITSIAVLPFVNASNNPEAEYLSDGISESLINSLSQVPNLRVVPRSTVFRYKARDIDPQTVGRELSVRAVLTGRVVQRGDTLSIQTDLIDVTEQSTLWCEQYNRKLADLLAVQEEISREISSKRG